MHYIGYHTKVASLRAGESIPEDDTLAEFIHSKFLNRFGLPAIADVNMVAFALLLEKYRNRNERIHLFTQFAFNESSHQVFHHECNSFLFQLPT